MTTTKEAVLEALKSALEDFFSGDDWTGGEVLVERNDTFPEEIPDGGLVNIIDGDPGEPEYALGFDGPYDYQHTVEIELYVACSDREERDRIYNLLVAGTGAGMLADRTLGGICFIMPPAQPEPLSKPVIAGDDIKTGLLRPVINYETADPI